MEAPIAGYGVRDNGQSLVIVYGGSSDDRFERVDVAADRRVVRVAVRTRQKVAGRDLDNLLRCATVRLTEPISKRRIRAMRTLRAIDPIEKSDLAAIGAIPACARVN